MSTTNEHETPFWKKNGAMYQKYTSTVITEKVLLKNIVRWKLKLFAPFEIRMPNKNKNIIQTSNVYKSSLNV